METEDKESNFAEMENKPILDISASIGFNCVGKELIAVHPSDMHFIWA